MVHCRSEIKESKSLKEKQCTRTREDEDWKLDPCIALTPSPITKIAHSHSLFSGF